MEAGQGLSWLAKSLVCTSKAKILPATHYATCTLEAGFFQNIPCNYSSHLYATNKALQHDCCNPLTKKYAYPQRVIEAQTDTLLLYQAQVSARLGFFISGPLAETVTIGLM
jgi:hypothetical protein